MKQMGLVCGCASTCRHLSTEDLRVTELSRPLYEYPNPRCEAATCGTFINHDVMHLLGNSATK